MALIKKSCEVDAGNLVADALTRSAAMALGIEDLGMIAANMKADLCIFDRPCEVSEKSNSLDLLNLVASQKPRHVLVDGTPVVIEGACVHEMVES
jgi:cytosine/adenosine deaminase-related metal-dependent hydrolase